MKFIKSTQRDGTEASLFYQDLGSGKPVVLVHGWPLDHKMWDYQQTALVNAGYRVISYDRKGFGLSDKPATGYDYDALADDLASIFNQLELSDAVLVGFSMAGGELVRYFSKHGGKGVAKLALISSIAPYMLKTDDNPDGVPQETLDSIAQSLQQDRAGFLADFGKQFYGIGLLNHPVSDAQQTADLVTAMQATSIATLQAAQAFGTTDLRPEMASINVPTLIVHGDADEVVPIKATGEQAAQYLPHATYKVYEGEPHGLIVTAKDRLSEDLIMFAAN